VDGGDGDDTLEGGAGDDLLIGGSDNDTVVYYSSKSTYGMEVVADRLVIFGSTIGRDVLEEIEAVIFAGRAYTFETLYAEADLVSHTELRINVVSPGKFSMTEIKTGPQADDSSKMQVVKYDGIYTLGFRNDARALLLWHQDKSNPYRNTSLDGLSLDAALGALDRGLLGAERTAFIELIGLIADCNIVDGVPIFNNDFVV
jgi:hypothetical protein